MSKEKHLKHIFKRAQRGLYAGEYIKFTESVSEYGNRTKRTVKPNIQRVKLWSQHLQKTLCIPVSMKALGLIDKAGGIDEYLLGQRKSESELAENLKRQILERKWQIEQGKGSSPRT